MIVEMNKSLISTNQIEIKQNDGTSYTIKETVDGKLSILKLDGGVATLAVYPRYANGIEIK